MATLISRQSRPELFTSMSDERSLTDLVNIIELVYAEISTKPEGYDQQELIRTLRASGVSNYDINTAISVLFQAQKLIGISSGR